jgi:dTDP-4-amino-4,6-dideoxygalactose transaminase
VNSGTDALILTLKALGIGQGDEVVTTPNTFVATVAAIKHVGAIPHLVDVGDDENIDPQSFARAIGPRTKAVIAVHLRGRPARMDAIKRSAEQHGILVLEDASQAFGATLSGIPVGRLGLAGCFSLHPQKILGACGDAGIVTTDDSVLADTLRLLRNHGLRGRDDVLMWGFNSRLDPIQAEILSFKLDYVDGWIRKNRRVARIYDTTLSELPLSIPIERPQEHCVYYQYSMMCEERDALVAHLTAKAIDARIHYPILLHKQLVGQDCIIAPQGLAKAEWQVGRQVSLPMFPDMTDSQLLHVINGVRSFYGVGALSSLPEGGLVDRLAETSVASVRDD